MSDDRLYTDGLLHLFHADPGFAACSLPSGPLHAGALRDMNASVAVVDGRAPMLFDLCSQLGSDVRLPVVAVSIADDETATAALMAGARGIVYRSEPPDRIPRAVRLVNDGGVWAPRSVLVSAFEQVRIDTSARASGESPLEQRLSSREREVFRHAAAGLGNKEVADRLSISEATVKVHLTHIFQKLGVRGRGELAAAYHGIRR